LSSERRESWKIECQTGSNRKWISGGEGGITKKGRREEIAGD